MDNGGRNSSDLRKLLDPELLKREPRFDRSWQRPPGDRKALSSAAATRGNMAPGVNVIELGAALLAKGQQRQGLEALVAGGTWVIRAMDTMGWVSLDLPDSKGVSADELRAASRLATAAVRKFRQGYEKAALDCLHDAVLYAGGSVNM